MKLTAGLRRFWVALLMLLQPLMKNRTLQGHGTDDAVSQVDPDEKRVGWVANESEVRSLRSRLSSRGRPCDFENRPAPGSYNRESTNRFSAAETLSPT